MVGSWRERVTLERRRVLREFVIGVRRLVMAVRRVVERASQPWLVGEMRFMETAVRMVVDVWVAGLVREWVEVVRDE